MRLWKIYLVVPQFHVTFVGVSILVQKFIIFRQKSYFFKSSNMKPTLMIAQFCFLLLLDKRLLLNINAQLRINDHTFSIRLLHCFGKRAMMSSVQPVLQVECNFITGPGVMILFIRALLQVRDTNLVWVSLMSSYQVTTLTISELFRDKPDQV